METAVVAVLSFDGVICMHYQATHLKGPESPSKCESIQNITVSVGS